MKLVIDTDPGIDDALAIAFAALHSGIELLALTSVFGNVTVAQATRNALHLAERFGLSMPVAEGAGQPRALSAPPPAPEVHGPEGLGDLPATPPQGAASEENAAELLCRLARAHPAELVVCPIGPMTNIAAALDLDPAFVSNVRRIVCMGGALDVPGNVTPFAEANAFHDPHALERVLTSGAALTMVGLDVTMQVLLDAADFSELARINPAHGPFLRAMSHFYLEFYRKKGVSGCGLHDPMAVIAALDPGLFATEATPLAVRLEGAEIGRTYRATGRSQVDVCLGCDEARIRAAFFDAFRARRPEAG